MHHRSLSAAEGPFQSFTEGWFQSEAEGWFQSEVEGWFQSEVEGWFQSEVEGWFQSFAEAKNIIESRSLSAAEGQLINVSEVSSQETTFK
jgi:hypothetical protein